jgi:Ser/Thr protein kinase RdoA (MazF antagonist)
VIDLELASRRQEITAMRRVAEEAIEKFSIQPVALSLLSHFCNTTFAVTSRDGARYALHIYRTFDETIPASRRHDWIKSELWWLQYVRSALDISAPVPMGSPEGDLVVSESPKQNSDLKLPVALFRWVDGRFVRRGLLPSHLRKVGMLTAALHLNASQFAAPDGFCRGQVDLVDEETEERVARVFASHSRAAETLGRKVLYRVRIAQDELGSGPDAFGFIHADIHQANYLFKQGQLALIDFGDCGWGHYLYDLAVTINEVRHLPNGSDLRRAFIAGYREVRDLPVQHEAQIDAFLLLRNVQDMPSYLDEYEPSYAHKRGQADQRLARLQRDVDIESKGVALP